MIGRLKSALGRLLRPSPPVGPGRDWVTHEDNPADARTLSEFRFFAIIGPWMEADVIEATVRNAFHQGAERVFVVDNDSPDDTVSRAQAAGAVLAASYTTEGFDHAAKYNLMNDKIEELSASDGCPHIWWLWLDADEFPHGPRGLTIRQYLETLDQRFRVVGARQFNHFPRASDAPHYLPGFHPLDFLPLCQEFPAPEFDHCHLGHWKHPLLRWDAGAPYIWAKPGFHQGECEIVPLLEPMEAVFLHHFPYRERADSEARLRAQCMPNEAGIVRNRKFDSDIGRDSGITKRFRTLDDVYGGRWDKVENLHVHGERLGIEPRPWSEVADPQDIANVRWYTQADLGAALEAWRAEREGKDAS